MFILLLFAFLGGIVTILSPCILPILPIVLSGTLTGGKKKPLGVVAGFILSFTFFTLFLTTIIKLTGISADALRTVSVVVIGMFGISLLVPKFQITMEKLFSRLATIAPQQKQNTNRPDFIAGFFIGLSLGLIWTPCVGPILASIITLAATSSINGGAIFITLAYSLGTAIPLFAITYGGRQLLTSHPWLLSHTQSIQKAFGILMLLASLGIFFSWDRQFQSYILNTFPSYGVGITKLEDNALVKNELDKLKNAPKISMEDLLQSDLGEAPEFIVGGAWINSPPLRLENLRGNVVLIDFWTYTCINCIRTLPYLKSWWKSYEDKGLIIVGVHTPEFAFEKEERNVKAAIGDFGITYPVMQDNNYATWQAYNNRYWPAHYLIDKNGKIRYTHFGEGKYDETERMIQKLLKETGATISATPNNLQYTIEANTHETYLGYQRMSGLASPEQIVKNKPTLFTTPNTISNNSFALGGTWTIGAERAMPQKGSTLTFSFDAKEVFLVMRPNKIGQAGGIRIYLDDKLVTDGNQGVDVQNGIVTINVDRLYKLINLPKSGPHILKIEVLDGDIELYAFTFG
ncbi:cytochrome c biogenesis protein DipZ [Candidatus Woesebacteria bacterium]|nr:cytochrome c biogenesis protein DipZ [Candidatus Woesebacteria bacterium]